MKRLLTGIMMLLTVCLTAAAQNKTVTGTVTDAKTGEPLIGATVRVPNAAGGVVTDFDGNYTISVPAGTKELQVVYIGYKQQNVSIKNGKASIALKEDSQLMDEVVVIGYGSVKKGDVTNAVAKVKGEDLEDRPVANVASALQGELAGVEVRTESGAPGGSVQIKVRGATTISDEGNANPLYVVDGVPMDEDFDLGSLNPGDIASIEVLKDASSSAIYGSRGANGVVIVTSKKGTDTGKTTVKATATFTLSTPERKMDVMNGQEWIEWITRVNNQRYVNNSTYANKGATKTDSYAERLAIIGSAGKLYVNDPRWSMPNYGGLALIDWQDEIFQTALMQKYDLSVASGTQKSNFRISMGYVDQQGVVVQTSFKRINLHLVGQTTVKDKLTLGLDIAPQYSKTQGGNVDGKDNAGMLALQLSPVAEGDAGIHTGAEPYGPYYWAGSQVSPIARIEQQDMTDQNFRLTSSAFARYQVTKDLQAEVMGSWIYRNRDWKRFIPSSVMPNRGTTDEGYLTQARWLGNISNKFMAQALLTYKKTIGVHNISAVAGWSVEHTKDASEYQLDATQFPNNSVHGFNMADVQMTGVKADLRTEEKLVSYFGRVEYGYDSRYLLNASLRRDGSSLFGRNRKWGTFPAASVAWRASNEHFWGKDWIVNQAKLRVSYGSNGMNSIPSKAAYGLLSSNNYSSAGTIVNGYTPSSTTNDDLGWQKTDSWNFGVDLGFFRNRISLAFDYYVKNIRDMLYEISMPSDIGYAKGWSNIGNIRNKGFELELKTENLTGQLRWTTTFTLGFNKNEVIDLGDNETIFTGFTANSNEAGKTQVIKVGHPVGEYYLYNAVGVYQTQADLDNYPRQESSVLGGIRYEDTNGDGVITEDDRIYAGHPMPDCTYGMTNRFSYKNWDLSFLITAQTGGKIHSMIGRVVDRQGMASSAQTNVLRKYANMWFSESEPGDGVTPSAFVSAGSMEQYDTRWLYSSDFIKLKNLSLSYRWRLPKNKYFVDLVRFTASAENLLMLDKYDGGYSPESNNSGSNSVAKSYDYGAYPMSRSFSFSVNLQF